MGLRRRARYEASRPAPTVPVMPHCDSSVLHAPGECRYCDARPQWQELRQLWRINFTGHADPDKAPCPSTHFRSLETIERWPGNVPR